MTPRRAGPTLTQRGVLGPPSRAAVPVLADTLSRRHCWVLDPPGAPGRWPGLLTEWRRGPGGWSGQVAYLVDLGWGPVLMHGWFDAGRLIAGPG